MKVLDFPKAVYWHIIIQTTQSMSKCKDGTEISIKLHKTLLQFKFLTSVQN